MIAFGLLIATIFNDKRR
ncbi:hypothetical protein [Lacticaseibacillus paracasei]